jgi:uracil-DNA glycosylase
MNKLESLQSYFGITKVGEWGTFFKQQFSEFGLKELLQDLAQHYAVQDFKLCPTYPAHVFRAFREPRLEQTRVIILGQDPYPNARQAEGLSFSSADEKGPLPDSLRNIFKELKDDLGIEAKGHSLLPWARQGVMLLNTCLTSEDGMAGIHRNQEGRMRLALSKEMLREHGYSWEVFTAAALRYAVKHNPNIIFVAWGKDARTLCEQVGVKNLITSSHPSPLSAHRGFFGSRCFSKINTMLEKQGRQAINWRV